MDLRLVDGDNVLWEDASLDGARTGTDAEGWSNYGGDKVWPSPQDQWETVAARAWPPPEGFDARPYTCNEQNGELVLRSELDPQYGIQTERRLVLAADRPVLTITTTFRKVAGQPVRTGIWVITQLRDPLRVFALLPEHPRLPGGYLQQLGPAPRELSIQGRVLGLARDPGEKSKIGLEAMSLLWVGAGTVLHIDAPERAGDYPDGGCHSEIYTNSDPLPYVELETLGPLTTLESGQETTWTNSYTLSRRSATTPAEEARRAFGC